MTLDESVDGLSKFESDGINFYMDPALAEFLAERGNINVDYVDHGGQTGYTIKVGDSETCGGCTGC
ncbi:MAG: hypothetical protein OEW00_03925 [candidate division Zixibacteria bacterium]|nr:hypothetical protein [candidate division Zixibacteria bacterium]